MSNIWPTTPLSTVTTVFADGDWIESRDQSADGLRLIQTGNVGEGEFKDRAEKARFISLDTFQRLRCTEIVPGDCLISRLPEPVGRACILPETGQRMITAVDCTIARFDERRIIPEFFQYYSQSRGYLGSVEREATGTTRRRISRARLGQIQVPLPQIEDQRRIVAILDEAFDGIATAKAHAERNLRNARSLLGRFLQASIPAGDEAWEEKTLEELCIIGDGNHSSNYPTKDEMVETGVPFIRATNLVAGRVSGADMRFLSPEKHAQLKKGHLRAGDILITNRGEIGKTALVDDDYDGANLNSQIAWLRSRELMNNSFLFRALNSEAIQSHFQSSKSGAALQQFTIKQLKALRVPCPSKAIQEVLADRLDELEGETSALAANYLRKLAALDELKQSLLHQAFSGQL